MKPIIQYLPFGELFVSQRNCEFDSRYKFTAKELDNETSYTYFGARYYDSELSVWLSVDPMSDKYPSLSPYIYSANNPIIYVDPDGHKIKLVNNYAGAMTNIAQIAATSLGNQVMSQLIGRNETYTMRSTFLVQVVLIILQTEKLAMLAILGIMKFLMMVVR